MIVTVVSFTASNFNPFIVDSHNLNNVKLGSSSLKTSLNTLLRSEDFKTMYVLYWICYPGEIHYFKYVIEGKRSTWNMLLYFQITWKGEDKWTRKDIVKFQ